MARSIDYLVEFRSAVFDVSVVGQNRVGVDCQRGVFRGSKRIVLSIWVVDIIIGNRAIVDRGLFIFLDLLDFCCKGVGILNAKLIDAVENGTHIGTVLAGAATGCGFSGGRFNGKISQG